MNKCTKIICVDLTELYASKVKSAHKQKHIFIFYYANEPAEREDNETMFNQVSTSLDSLGKVYLFGAARGGAVGGTSLRCGTELIQRPVKQLRMQNRKCLIAKSMHIHKLNNRTYYNML